MPIGCYVLFNDSKKVTFANMAPTQYEQVGTDVDNKVAQVLYGIILLKKQKTKYLGSIRADFRKRIKCLTGNFQSIYAFEQL